MKKITLWTTEVNVDTGKVERSVQQEDEGYPSFATAEEAYENGCSWGAAGYATFDDDGYRNVYAESLKSQEDADRLVIDLAENLGAKLLKAAAKVRGGKK